MKVIKRILRLFILSGIILLLVIFATQNYTPVNLQFFETQWEELPLSFVLFGAFSLGLVLVGLGSIWEILRLGRAAKRHQKTIDKLEKELDALRTLSITEQKEALPASTDVEE